MKQSYYYRISKDNGIPRLTVGGSISGPKIGEIDITVAAAGKTKGTIHGINAVLTLEDATQLANDILSEVAEVYHKINTGKWKHELADVVADSSIPANEVHFRNSQGETVGKIANLKEES